MSPFFLGLGLILAGGLAAARSGTLFRFLVATGCVVGSVPAFAVLAGGAPRRASVPVHMPGGPWVLGIDALSAWFLLIVFGVGAAGALYRGELPRPEGTTPPVRRGRICCSRCC